MSKLTKQELETLAKALEHFERSTLNDTGMRHINGGYAKAEMFDYDEDAIDIELEWGEQDMGSGSSTCHKENYTLERSTLKSGKPINEMVAQIETA
jgi:hypothetical protein